MTALANPANPVVAAPAPVVDFQTTDPLREPCWNQWIRSFLGASIFHSAEWAAVLHRTYGHKPCFVTAWRGDRLVGVLPMMEVNSWLTGRRGVGLPFSDACSPLLQEEVPFDSLFDVVVSRAGERRWQSIEVRGMRAMPQAVPSASFVGHTLSLDRSPEAVIGRFTAGVRQAVRKAQREGVETEISPSPETMRAYYELHCRTRQRHGVPPQSWQFFENITHGLCGKGMGFVVVARWRGTPVAGAVFLCFHGQGLFKFGASDHRFQHLRGSDLVMVEGIRALCRQGCRELSFGRTATNNAGLRRFKRGFGAVEVAIQYLKYDLRQAAFVREGEGLPGWASRLMRQVPRPLAAFVGRFLYPHWS